MVTLDLRAPTIIIRFDKGKTLTPVFYYLDDNNQPIDISSYSFRMQARQDYSSPVLPGWDLTLDNGGLALAFGTATLPDGTTVPNAYGVKLNVPASVVASLTVESALYDIELIDPTGIVYPFVKGILYPEDEVTK